MVSSQCGSCMRHISIPSNPARPNRHVCEVCKTGFCNICGTPFICRKCLAQLNMNDQRAIRQQSERYRAKAAGGTVMSAAGAVLLMIAGYTLTIGVDKVGHFALAGRKRKPAGPRLVGENEATSINLH